MNRLSREVAESPFLEVLKNMWMWHFRTRFNDEHGNGAKLIVRLE